MIKTQVKKLKIKVFFFKLVYLMLYIFNIKFIYSLKKIYNIYLLFLFLAP